QAGEYGRTVGKANFTYSAAAKGITFSITSLTDLPTPGLLANPRLAELLEQAQGEIAPLKNTVLGRTPWELSHDRSRLSLLGQWSADVMRTAVKADIAFLNGGGLRTSIQAGEITVGKMYEVMPFDNTLYVVELDGKQVMDILQHGIKNQKVGMLQFSGLRVHYDAAMPAGERITATMADGTPLVLDRLYKVVTNDFMAAGGDEYNTFKEGENGFDTHIPLREELMKALKKQQLLRYEGDNRFTEAGAAYKKAA
ncbi:MAG: 5'-nucleotidase C-terminal domain-containing protein, partial [Bacillota bacterium]